VAEALRELGTPAVLSAEGALASLSEGERVRIDGERGSIHRMTESLTP
jgi:phosphohistidine swiveling domain-containing protein